MTKAQEIRKLRESLGWSQRRLGEAVGLADCTVSRAETGQGNVGEGYLNDMLRALRAATNGNGHGLPTELPPEPESTMPKTDWVAVGRALKDLEDRQGIRVVQCTFRADEVAQAAPLPSEAPVQAGQPANHAPVQTQAPFEPKAKSKRKIKMGRGGGKRPTFRNRRHRINRPFLEARMKINRVETLKDLAELLDMNYTTLSGYVNGHALAPVELLDKLVQLLGGTYPSKYASKGKGKRKRTLKPKQPSRAQTDKGKARAKGVVREPVKS